MGLRGIRTTTRVLSTKGRILSDGLPQTLPGPGSERYMDLDSLHILGLWQFFVKRELRDTFWL